MASLTTHLAKRAIESYGSVRKAGMPPRVEAALQEIRSFETPMWFNVVSVITVVAFLVTFSLVNYSIGEVVSTLLMVESPQKDAAGTAPPAYQDKEDSDAPLLSETDKINGNWEHSEADLVPALQSAAPITSSIRGTFCHLRARAGHLAKYRGLRLHILAGVISVHLTGLLQSIFRGSGILSVLSTVLATVAVSPLLLTWTHIVISEPSSKYFFQRIPSARTCLKIVPATLFIAVAVQSVILLPATLARVLAIRTVLPQLASARELGQQREVVAMAIAHCVMIVAVTVFAAVMVLVPAQVMLTRVQASLLPESDKTIVPMDRTFGGKVVAESLGGSGKLGLVDAWRTFGYSSRVQLLKLWVKLFMIQMAIAFTFGTLLAFEAGIAFHPIMCNYHVMVKSALRGELAGVSKH